MRYPKDIASHPILFHSKPIMSRPKVVRARGLMFYPVRRACSSAIQLALGYDFIDWRVAAAYKSFHHFTCYRNTFDRLRSLYFNFVQPAPQGQVDFDLDPTDSFETWIIAVCKTKDATCDEHLHSQDWHTLIPGLRIWQFDEIDSLFKSINVARPEQLGRASPDLSHLSYSDSMLRLIERRYADEIRTFHYAP